MWGRGSYPWLNSSPTRDSNGQSEQSRFKDIFAVFWYKQGYPLTPLLFIILVDCYGIEVGRQGKQNRVERGGTKVKQLVSYIMYRSLGTSALYVE